MNVELMRRPTRESTPADEKGTLAFRRARGLDLVCTLPRPLADGRSALGLTPFELLQRLAPLVPPPREVRKGTGSAPDVYKNAYYAECVMPGGRYFSCQGLEVFLVHPDYRAADARMRSRDDGGRGGPPASSSAPTRSRTASRIPFSRFGISAIDR